MHHVMMGLGRRSRDQRGAVALMVALSMTALLIASAMVLDFGLVRIDRQVNKSGADAATTAGLYGLMGGDGKAHPYQGICAAIGYLKQNDPRFSGVTSSGASTSWTDGSGLTQSGVDCTSATWQNKTCTAGTVATWAKYAWTGTYQGQALKVEIQSGYALATSGFTEEALPEVLADGADTAQGCDQMAVVVTQNRKPGLGSLASTADLVSRIRTVGRIYTGPGGDAPAMLLLKRTGCPVLSTGSNSGSSYIHVYGAVSSNGKSQPGSIHSDSDGVSCSTLFEGKAGSGIVAYAAPQISSPLLPDPSKPGQVTSVAGANGISPVIDGSGNVYGSAAINESGAASATKTAPSGRALVTRKLIDDRYLAGVSAAVSGAQTTVFGSLNAGNAGNAANGYTVLADCNPSSLPAAAAAATKLFIDCTDNNGYKGTATINAQTVVFNGRINPSATVSMPNATKVYVFGVNNKPAIELTTGTALSVHSAGNVTAGKCTTTDTGGTVDKAIVFLRDGEIKQGGGSLQLCYTSLIMMGGQANACLPTVGYVTAAAPSPKPCTPPSGPVVTGTGQLSQTGGSVDWTAPNQYDLMVQANGDPDPARAPAWGDPSGPEDLAFWSESGVSPSTTYNIGGGGALNTTGVYMVPNADPFIIGGNSHQDLTNAQYIATSIALNGSPTSVSMRVDANSAVQLPKLRLVGLVR